MDRWNVFGVAYCYCVRVTHDGYLKGCLKVDALTLGALTFKTNRPSSTAIQRDFDWGP